MRVTFKVSDEHFEVIRIAADRKGLSVSAFIRLACLALAEATSPTKVP